MTNTISSRERLSSHTITSDSIFAQQQSDEVVDGLRPNLGDAPRGSRPKGDRTSKTIAETTSPLATGLQIVHATSGRVRIRATDGTDSSILDRICKDLQKQNGVNVVTANEKTGSLIVNFDENQLSLSQMLALLQEYGIQPQAAPQTLSNTDLLAPWKSVDFWKEQGISFIPLFTGLAVTSGLGVSGLASIGVYMITANVTRSAIDYLPQVLAQKTKDSDPVAEENRHKTSQPPLAKVEGKNPINKKVNTDLPAFEEVATPTKIEYKVVHTIPGRIRFNLPRLAKDSAYARRLERLLKTDPTITSVRINCDAASVAIAYNKSDIPVSYWVDKMQLADEINPPTTPIKTTTEQPEKQKSQPTEVVESTIPQQTIVESGLWSNFKPPALSAGLAFIANFPLNA